MTQGETPYSEDYFVRESKKKEGGYLEDLGDEVWDVLLEEAPPTSPHPKKEEAISPDALQTLAELVNPQAGGVEDVEVLLTAYKQGNVSTRQMAVKKVSYLLQNLKEEDLEPSPRTEALMMECIEMAIKEEEVNISSQVQQTVVKMYGQDRKKALALLQKSPHKFLLYSQILKEEEDE